MSRFNDPRYLESRLARAHEGGFVLDRDRACKGCGYDLTGLRYGGLCPECARPIRYGRAMKIPIRDRLQDAPVWYIRLIQGGFLAMALGGVGISALTLLIAGVTRSLFDMQTAALALLPFTVLWLAGVGALCLPKPSTEGVERSPHDDLAWRAAAFGSQAMWPVAALLAAIPAWSATVLGRPINLVIAWAATAAGFVGFGAAAWVASSFHEWMQDDRGAEQFRRRAFWLLTIAAFLLLGGSFRALVPIPVLTFVLWMIDGATALIGLGLVVALVWSLVGLSRMAAWSIASKRTDAARTERLRRRREAESAAEQARLRDAPIDPAPTYWKAPVPPKQGGHGGPDRVAGADGRR